MGGVQNNSGNSGEVGGGGGILVVKNWKFWGGGGAYVKFPPWWGYGYFLELHTPGVSIYRSFHCNTCSSLNVPHLPSLYNKLQNQMRRGINMSLSTK